MAPAGCRAGLSKLNSMRAASPRLKAEAHDLPGPVDIARAERARGERRGAREESRRHWTEAQGIAILPTFGALVEGLPRKEVIQPQLPLRLPCYDFTPVASPTFDGSLQRLGHRLRVLLTPMV